jgi:hypothetical protein
MAATVTWTHYLRVILVTQILAAQPEYVIRQQAIELVSANIKTVITETVIGLAAVQDNYSCSGSPNASNQAPREILPASASC